MMTTPVTKLKLMNTLIRAEDKVAKQLPKFFEAADNGPGIEELDCSGLNTKFDFAVVNIYCQQCKDTHWSLMICEKSDCMSDTLDNGDELVEYRPYECMEDAVEMYHALISLETERKH